MKRLLIFLFVCLAISSCRKVAIYHNLSEEEANEILVVLQQEGVECEKIKEVKQQETVWTIRVDSKKVAVAQSLLLQHSLPRKKVVGLGDIYIKDQLIPTPDEQKARFLVGLKGDIINSLKKIPEVIDADVVLNVPTQQEFAGPDVKEKRPTASVIIKAKPNDEGMEALSEAKIQQYVANAVENLNPRDVVVILTYISQPRGGLKPGQSLILPSTQGQGSVTSSTQPTTRIAGLEVVGGSEGRLKIYLSIFFILLALLAAALIITIIRTSRIQQELRGYKGPDTKALVEGKVVEK